MLKTRTECITKIVKFYLDKNKVLEISQQEAILVAATNLTKAFKYHDSKIALKNSKATNEALHKLANIFLYKARLRIVHNTPIQKTSVSTVK